MVVYVNWNRNLSVCVCVLARARALDCFLHAPELNCFSVFDPVFCLLTIFWMLYIRSILILDFVLFNRLVSFYADLPRDSPSWKRIYFTLAAITQSNYSRTSKKVWGDEGGVISLFVLRRTKASDIWRLCRVSVGLSVDYG